jgi:hypothetical protein
VEPGLLVLKSPIFYLTSAVSLVAIAAAWICAAEWRARRMPSELERLAARLTGGAR